MLQIQSAGDWPYYSIELGRTTSVSTACITVNWSVGLTTRVFVDGTPRWQFSITLTKRW
ncbi:MAG: hypothetical protein IID44_25765 [Planctomycetes bacterium]|nr:hypothetical protein [Planctomycetota bacterium]